MCLSNRHVLTIRWPRNNSESQQYQDMSSHRFSINWRSWWKKTQIRTSLMTSSVRKVSFNIGLGVCQVTLMSTKRTDVVRMWRQFHGCHPSGDGIEWVFFSTGKQHDALKKRTMDKSLENTLKTSINTMLSTRDDKGNCQKLHRWWWHIQETQVVYSVRRLVGGRGWRRWLWYGLTQWF